MSKSIIICFIIAIIFQNFKRILFTNSNKIRNSYNISLRKRILDGLYTYTSSRQHQEAVGGNIAIVATTGNIKGDDYIGGVVGDLSASINDAFSINVIKGYEYVGGVFGYVESYAPIVRRVYSASMIKAPDGRGLAASALYVALDPSTCFFDGTVAQVESGGLPTASMLKQETYSTYDFDAVWEIQEDISYPYFKGMGQMEPGKLDDDGTVNFLAGKGTERNPYQIHNYEELKYIGKYEYTLDKYYKLMGNIDASLSKRENCNADGSICKGFEPIGEFSGVFIGDNKIIAGLNINRSDEDSVGLFRALAKNARVTGIVFDTTSYFGEDYTHGDSSDKGFVRGKNYVGTLAGVDNGAVVENIFVKNDVIGDNYVGSVVGKKTSGIIERSASRFLVSGKEYVGGLVGYLDDAIVSDCYSIANVVGERNVGGEKNCLHALAASASGVGCIARRCRDRHLLPAARRDDVESRQSPSGFHTIHRPDVEGRTHGGVDREGFRRLRHQVRPNLHEPIPACAAHRAARLRWRSGPCAGS